MKKILIYLTTLFLIAVFTIAGTYAYFSGFVTRQKAVESGTHQIQVIYSGAEPIEGEIELTVEKTEDMRRELTIALDENSLAAAANFYIHADKIDPGISRPGFKWEFYEVKGEEEEFISSGTFENLKSNERIYMKNGLVLSTEVRKFAVYFWANGHEVGNEAVDQVFMGYVGAETEPVTGDIDQ